MIKTIFDTSNDYKVAPEIDTSLRTLLGSDCVIDKGDNFQLHQKSGLTYYFEEGCVANVGGSFFHISQRHEFTLNAGQTIYLCLRINPSTTSDKGSVQFLTSVNMQHGNILDGETRDLLLYVVTTSSSGITNTQDRRVIKSQQSSVLGEYSLWCGTQQQYNVLTKDSDTLYFIKE